MNEIISLFKTKSSDENYNPTHGNLADMCKKISKSKNNFVTNGAMILANGIGDTRFPVTIFYFNRSTLENMRIGIVNKYDSL